MKNNIDIFEKEIKVEYRNEIYSVRDNGAILRHSKNVSKPRKLDNI